MILTAENYFSPEAQIEYMSYSQIKAFDTCEAAAMAELRGERSPPKSAALLIGGYVDARFSGETDQFIEFNPELLKKDGSLKAEYIQADAIIRRIKRDSMMTRYLSGQKQVIMTGQIDGFPFKIKIDSYHPGKAIVDLKTVRSFGDVWTNDGKVSFVEAWGYDMQGAIYQAVEGHKLPFFLAAATKEAVPDIAVISIPQDALDNAMAMIRHKLSRIDGIKRGEIEPIRCEKCDWCKETKVLTEAIDYRLM